MKPKIKHKTALILILGGLLSLASPAEAQAPRPSKEVRLAHIALQEPKKYAKIKMAEYGWNARQYVCLSHLWTKESHWNHKADNPTSSAYGIAQLLGEISKSPVTQINNGLRYIKHRYGKSNGPCNAWQHWRKRNWY